MTAPRVGNSVYTQNNAKQLFGPRVGAGLGSVRQRQDRGPRGLRHVLFADRRSELPAELAAAVQRLGLLLRIVASRSLPITPGVRPRPRAARASSTLHYLSPRKDSAGREDAHACRNGIFTVEQQLNREHVAARGLRRFVRISRIAQRRSQHHSAADLRQRQRLPRGRHPGTDDRHRAARRAIHSRSGARGRIRILGAGFFWYTEGNSSYNALQMDVTHRFSQACSSAPITPGRRIWT